MIVKAFLIGSVTLLSFLFFYVAGYLSIPKDMRRSLADVSPWAGLLIFVAVLFAGIAAWLAFGGNRIAAIAVILGGTIVAGFARGAVRRVFLRSDDG
ncbi:MAG: hypothetical protein ACYTHM_10885 [Planctomycetota bacterium]|jgi:hypothetical protein